MQSIPHQPQLLQQSMPPPHASPRRPIAQILAKYSDDKDAGRVAVHLVQFYFFGETELSNTTAARLDAVKMKKIKTLISSKFGAKRSFVDKEKLWGKCRVVIGQKCKQLRKRNCS